MEELMKKLDKKLKIISYEYMNDILSINLERTNKSAICPCCGKNVLTYIQDILEPSKTYLFKNIK